MSFNGITWLDGCMAAITLLGLFLTWRQARKATTAADGARAAMSATREELATRELMNELRFTRKAISDVEAATDRNEIEVAQFTLVQLSESMRRAVSLARDPITPETQESVIQALDELSLEASKCKAQLARNPPQKVIKVTGDLVSKLLNLSHALLDIVTIQNYAIREEK